MDHLESFIAECDRRTELAKKRLAETQEEISAEVSAKVCGEGGLYVLAWSLSSPQPRYLLGLGGRRTQTHTTHSLLGGEDLL